LNRLLISTNDVCNISVQCYECELSASGCNQGPLLDNDTKSICPVGDPGVGCWVSRLLNSNSVA